MSKKNLQQSRKLQLNKQSTRLLALDDAALQAAFGGVYDRKAGATKLCDPGLVGPTATCSDINCI